MNYVEIIEKQDPSVNELLNKTAKELHKKYNKQRRIKDKFLKKKTPFQKFMSVCLDVFCIGMIFIAGIICVSCLNASFNGCIPSFFGYTNMIVSSESMVDSGFNIGDPVLVHTVKPETLKKGDIIAFYRYPTSYAGLSESDFEKAPKHEGKTKFSLTVSDVFGFKSDEVKAAAQSGSRLIFHHVSDVYVDENGDYWFTTYGSSNPSEDNWYVHESLIVGTYDDSLFARAIVGLLKITTKPHGVWILTIPAMIVLVIMICSFIKHIQVAKLELDCVEEKRKITDPICVKNKVGYQMSRKTKYKILAQATEENREEYIKLLWKDGYLPDSVKKYYIRKRILLRPMEEKLKLNRECEGKFKRGNKPANIAKYYLKEKERIETREREIRRRLRSIKRYKKA